MNRISLNLATALCTLLIVKATLAAETEVKWLDTTPPSIAQGISFGVPWPKGAVKKDQTFTLTAASGTSLPAQSWTMGYWPDGSIKWTGFATVVGPEVTSVKIATAPAAAQPGASVKVTRSGNLIQIDTGKIKAVIPTQGQNLVNSITVGETEVARNGQLELIDQVGPETDYLKPSPREQYTSDVKKVTIEQQGPVRAVVKFEGTHKAVNGSREWLPFVVRLYFFADQEQIRMVHTIIYDGDMSKDFIRGLGLVFDVPLRNPVGQRVVRFGNSNGGLWSENSITLGGRGGGGGGGGRGGRGGAATQPGADGGRASIIGVRGTTAAQAAEGPAQWSDYKLLQPNSEGFKITKRTNNQSSWVPVAEGERAAGLVFAGDPTGGLAVGVKNFWQSYPSALEVQGLVTDTAKVTAWLWSPDGPAMDMRWYDTVGHGHVNTSGSYEDYEPAFADPVGVGRTSDLMLFPQGALPSRETTAAQAMANSKPPLLVTTPEYMHSTGVFGPQWSVQDRSTPFKKAAEDKLDSGVDYYIKQVDEQHWYGYWDFGDVRHTYDPGRHEWRYDVGGYAWDNSELGSVIWAWNSYIRTGRADYFRFAEAMVRHTSEVDTYHMGRFAGLGSRHNVVHWGDSAKEARISQSAHDRFYYFITTDERMGDNMSLETNVDKVASELDPMRKARPKTEAEAKYPGRVRIGPDWLAFAGNWMTEWERTGDAKWRDKIMAGVNSMYEMPYWMRSGAELVMGYDYNTGKLYQVNDQPGRYNLPTIQGGGEVGIELTGLLSDPKWSKMWSQYCRIGAANAETILKDKETGAEGADASLVGESSPIGVRRLAAFAYSVTKNPAFAQFALRGMGTGPYPMQRIEGAEALNPLDESAGVSTNDMAQSSLNDISALALCADQLPKDAPAPAEGGGGRFGGRGGRGGGRGNRGAPAGNDSPAAGGAAGGGNR